MKIEFYVSSQGIQKMKSAQIQATENIYLPEVCSGNIIIMSALPFGNALYLEQIFLIDFLYDFKNFLLKSRNLKTSSESIMDMNQSYAIRLSKAGDVLKLETLIKREPQSIELSFSKTTYQLDLLIDRFFDDLLYFCPELRKHPDVNKLNQMFDLNIWAT